MTVKDVVFWFVVCAGMVTIFLFAIALSIDFVRWILEDWIILRNKATAYLQGEMLIRAYQSHRDEINEYIKQKGWDKG